MGEIAIGEAWGGVACGGGDGFGKVGGGVARGLGGGIDIGTDEDGLVAGIGG